MPAPPHCHIFFILSKSGGKGNHKSLAKAKVSSAETASWPPTVALASATATGPFCFRMVHSSSSTSPGVTWRRKRAFLMPPNRPIFPLFSGMDSMVTAPTWARASMMSTPGITWYWGKWPWKKGSLTVTHLMPLAHLPTSPSTMRSTRAKG